MEISSTKKKKKNSCIYIECKINIIIILCSHVIIYAYSSLNKCNMCFKISFTSIFFFFIYVPIRNGKSTHFLSLIFSSG